MAQHHSFHIRAAWLGLATAIVVGSTTCAWLFGGWSIAQLGLASLANGRRWQRHKAAEWALTGVLLLAPWLFNLTSGEARWGCLVLGLAQAAAWLSSHENGTSPKPARVQALQGPRGSWSH